MASIPPSSTTTTTSLPSVHTQRQALHAHDDDDPRPSSTSVVATLRHSPRLLLRKSASALKEPAQSPDIFARGPGPALRASTRLQTRNASARMSNTRPKRSSRQPAPSTTHPTTQEEFSSSAAFTAHHTSPYSSSQSTTTTTTTSTTRTASLTMTAHSETIQSESTEMALDGPVQTRSSRAAMATIVTVTESRVSSLTVSAPDDTQGTGMERRSRVATRSTSQTREPARSRARTLARTRAIPPKRLKVPGEAEKSDEDDDDDEDARSKHHVRPPPRHRRRSIPKTLPDTSESSSLAPTPRLTRLGARHESGHDIEDVPDQETPHRTRHVGHGEEEKEGERKHHHGRRSRSSTSTSSQDNNATKTTKTTSTYTSSGPQSAPRKVKKKTLDHRKVPSLPASRRRLRARTTKVAKMGIDGEAGAEEEEEDEDEEEEEEEEEDEDEDEDAEYDTYPRVERDEEMMDVDHAPTAAHMRKAIPEDAGALSASDILNGFIASKPEALQSGLSGPGSAYQGVQPSKRKVDDEDMEDPNAAMSMDEGQVVSTKLARIEEGSDSGDKNGYFKTFYSIKSPRGDEDEGILSSESEDADLESEDDEDDFEEIDVWEFIATLPPLGPLPQNFVFTMPEKTESTPPITLVLDIDETLVHCATRPLDSPDIVFPVEYNQETWEVYGRLRPGMLDFLEKMSTKFEVITFTASQECYAEALLKIIDPEKKYIKHRYYRDSCVPVFGNYVKDLRILNRDLSKVVIIDNSPQAFGYQISNGIPIESWYDDKSDRELAKVMTFLETLDGVEDVRPKIDEFYKLQERIQKALALASHHQISSFGGLGNLGATLASSGTVDTSSGASSGTNSLASLQSAVPDQLDMDSNMMLFDLENQDQNENVYGDQSGKQGNDEHGSSLSLSKGRGQHEKPRSATGSESGGTGNMTMTTRSSGLDTTNNLAKISL